MASTNRKVTMPEVVACAGPRSRASRACMHGYMDGSEILEAISVRKNELLLVPVAVHHKSIGEPCQYLVR